MRTDVVTLPEPASAAQPAPFVSVRQLSKTYPNGLDVLRDISFDATAGELVSLIGPSGCGKSTILRLLAGLLEKSSGSVSIDGQSPQEAREITSFVFQEATLLPWRTVASNVALTLELEGAPLQARKAKTAEMLKLVGLQDYGHLYPRQLSGGMKMRVSIARALVSSPQLMLMDEPFGALDEITRNRLNEELLRLKERQKWTAFFVTHSVAEAVFLSSRILVMAARPGRIHREITIDLPAERTPGVRKLKRYVELVAEVTTALYEVYA